MTHEEKRPILTQILNMAKKNQLSAEQKNIIFDIIMNSDRTEKQKDRYIKFYNLDINNPCNYNLTTLAKECGCKPAAIKFALQSVNIHTLLHDENIEILKKIIEA